MTFQCPYCSHEGQPVFVEKRMSSNGWIVFVILLCFCLPLCWLPFFIDALQEEVRLCVNCRARID